MLAAILLTSCCAYSQEIKFPKIDTHPLPADYSFFQNHITTSTFRFDDNERNGFQMDFRNCDLSGYDLNDNRDMMYASFNSKTKFPAELPKGFEPVKILELGKNPGLGLRQLHAGGITGKGIGIGIIDQSLLVEHVEYADNLRLYEEIHCLGCNVSSMHAPAVASIAAGKTIGVAPGADLYFIGQTNGNKSSEGVFEFDLGSIAQSINRLITINKQLPKERKIRVISISLAMVKQWKGYDEAIEAIQNARQNGIFVLTVEDENFRVDGLERLPLANPDNKDVFSAGLMFCGNQEGSGNDTLQVPMDSRTLADPNGKEDYYFSRIGGQSWIIPWTAGLYALACQVDADITPEAFWTAALETADAVSFRKAGKTYTLNKVVNPVKLIAKIQATKTTNTSEKTKIQKKP